MCELQGKGLSEGTEGETGLSGESLWGRPQVSWVLQEQAEGRAPEEALQAEAQQVLRRRGAKSPGCTGASLFIGP